MQASVMRVVPVSRRDFLAECALGAAAVSVLDDESVAAAPSRPLPGLPHSPPRARRVIYLFQSGGPSQVDTFDYKPQLLSRFGEELPDGVRQGQRLTGMTSGQASFPVAPSIFRFRKNPHCGTWVSDLLPHTRRIAHELCLTNSMYTEAINHAPGITFRLTGAQQTGRPSLGAWVTYGLGNSSNNLPSFVVMVSRGTGKPDGQGVFSNLWGAGFLPSKYQGVRFRSSGDPVQYLSNPPGIDDALRRTMLDDLTALNRQLDLAGDGRTTMRMAQYEMAYRMQTSVPELTDLSGEPEHVFHAYGPDSRVRGTFAANCLLARRLVERGVRFVQLLHRGWDQHEMLPRAISGQCRDVDQPTAALIADLKQRGLLDDTLVVWGGEFGRTVFCQNKLTHDNYGRDHHPRCFTGWMAGGGVKPGIVYGETDDYSYNIVRDPIHVHDWNATLLYLLGIDHTRLTFKYQGRHHRLTDVEGRVVHELLT